MEQFYEQIKLRLNPPGLIDTIGVYLGPENRDDKRQLPHVLLMPESADINPQPIEPRPGVRGELVTHVMGESVAIHAYARTYTGARALALNALEAVYLSSNKSNRVSASMRYMDIDDTRPIRVAILTVTVDYTLSLGHIVPAHLNEIIQNCRLLPKEDVPYVRRN